MKSIKTDQYSRCDDSIHYMTTPFDGNSDEEMLFGEMVSGL